MGKGDFGLLSRYLEDLSENVENKDLTLPSSSSLTLLQTVESHLSPFSYSPSKISSPIKRSPKKSRGKEMNSSPNKGPKTITNTERGGTGRSKIEVARGAAMKTLTPEEVNDLSRRAAEKVLSPEEVNDLTFRAAKKVTDRIFAERALEKQKLVAVTESARTGAREKGGEARPPLSGVGRAVRETGEEPRGGRSAGASCAEGEQKEGARGEACAERKRAENEGTRGQPGRRGSTRRRRERGGQPGRRGSTQRRREHGGQPGRRGSTQRRGEQAGQRGRPRRGKGGRSGKGKGGWEGTSAGEGPEHGGSRSGGSCPSSWRGGLSFRIEKEGKMHKS